jgi:hypothetical protein
MRVGGGCFFSEADSEKIIQHFASVLGCRLHRSDSCAWSHDRRQSSTFDMSDSLKSNRYHAVAFNADNNRKCHRSASNSFAICS